MTLTLENSHPYLRIDKSKRGGRGVFAHTAIPKGCKFLVDPIIVVTDSDCENYIYEHQGKVFLGLGYSSLINHSNKSDNCVWSVDFKEKAISFTATKIIKKDSEILHSYNWPDYPERFKE